MVEFDFIRRILKARFQKFFKENKPLFRTLSEQSSLDRDSHLEDFYHFLIRVIREIRVRSLLLSVVPYIRS